MLSMCMLHWRWFLGVSAAAAMASVRPEHKPKPVQAAAKTSLPERVSTEKKPKPVLRPQPVRPIVAPIQEEEEEEESMSEDEAVMDQ